MHIAESTGPPAAVRPPAGCRQRGAGGPGASLGAGVSAGTPGGFCGCVVLFLRGSQDEAPVTLGSAPASHSPGEALAPGTPDAPDTGVLLFLSLPAGSLGEWKRRAASHQHRGRPRSGRAAAQSDRELSSRLGCCPDPAASQGPIVTWG